MKQIKWFVPLAVGLLAACSSETSEQLASAAPSRASGEDFAAAAASSPIAAQIFNSPQEQDILSSSRQAMAEVSASEVAAAASAASAALSVDAENNLALPALAPACERYFRRAEQCFSQNENRDALLAMLDEAREELAHEQPDEAACTDLNRSFDAVARNLGCH